VTRPPSLVEAMSTRWCGSLVLFIATASASIAQVLL
jgi:hypothetical protein